MNTSFGRSVLAAAFVLAAGVASAGTATVTFADPDHFADLPRIASDRAQVLTDLTGHFNTLAAKLPPGQEMTVQVTDLDLAGRNWPGALGTRDLRVLEGGADWPHINFHYEIKQDGKVIKSGDEIVQNMDYLWRLNRYSSGDTLRYEKQMLDTWFKDVIAAR